MSNGERTVIAGGLIGGLFLGAFLFRGGNSADKTDTAANVAAVSTTPHHAATTADSEVEALREQIAALEKEKLAQRLAELEADTAEPAEAAPSQPEHPAAASVRKPVTGSAAPRREPVPPSSPKNAAREGSAAGPATLAYWNALNDVIARESAMRTPPPNVTAANAGGFVESRLQAGRFATGAIRDLDTTGVDPDAIALGRELVAWYQEEVTLNERASSLIGSGSVAERKGTAGNSWRSGEAQHHKKCDDLNRHGAELRTRLARKYSLAFPPLN